MIKPIKFLSYLLSAGVVASSLFIVSCSKDDDPTSIVPDVEIPTEFDSRTSEEHKSQLEDNGIQMVNNLEEMKNTQAVKSSISFNFFLSEASLPENGRTVTSNKAVKMLVLLSNLGIGKANAADVLKSFRTQEEEDPSTPQELFDDVKGTYTYNKTNNEWDFAANSNQIVFKFPSTKTGTTNDATFAIYGLTTVTVVNNEAEYEGDLPTALKADLTIGSTKHLEYNFSASYKSNGEPTLAETSLIIGAFKFSAKVVNNTSEVAVDYGMTKNSSNIISFGAGATGDFSSEALGGENAGDAVNTGSAYFQLMNVRFAGTVQVAALADALDAANSVQAEATAYNANVELVVFYADSKKKIADTEVYQTTRTEEYEECNWNPVTEEVECEIFEEESDALDVRLVFADGSKADLATYTEVGFEDVEEELNAFVDQLEADLD